MYNCSFTLSRDLCDFLYLIYQRTLHSCFCIVSIAYGVSQCVRYVLDYNILFAVRGNKSGNNQNAWHGGLMLKELSVRVARMSEKDCKLCEGYCVLVPDGPS